MNKKIQVANGNNLERRGVVNSIIRMITLPVLNLISENLLRKTAKASSKDASNILENTGSTHALEVMYTRHNRKLFSRGILQGIADWYWHHVISQLKAIRNRLRIVEDNLESEIKKRIKDKIGMAHEGCLHKHTKRFGKYYDLETYGILREY